MTTLAGNGTPAYLDGATNEAEFDRPVGVAVSPDGSVLVADTNNNRIRRIQPSGNVTTMAGNGKAGFVDGTGGATGTAEFNGPVGIALDPAGNVYVAEVWNNRVRKIDPTGNTSTLTGNGTPGFVDGSGGPTGSSEFGQPMLIATSASGSLIIADSANSAIRSASLGNGTTGTVAGNVLRQGWSDGTGGPSGTAAFHMVGGTAIDSGGNIYVTDILNSAIRKIASDGTTTTLAGNGTCGYADGTGGRTGTAEFNTPYGVAVGRDGRIYVSDADDNHIRMIDADGTTRTLAGSTAGYRDGDGSAAAFNGPAGIAFDAAGNLYVADQLNNRIRKIAFQ